MLSLVCEKLTETLFWLEKLEPFGEKNPPPLFAVLDASLIRSWIWGDDQHLRLLVKQGRESQEMVVINGKKKAANLVNSSLAEPCF